MTFATIMLSICGLLIALGGACIAVPRIWRAFVGCSDFVATANRVMPQLKIIAYEFSPNGGNSMKDQIGAMKKTLESHTKTLNEQSEDITAIKLDVVEIKEQQTTLREAAANHRVQT